MGFPTQPSLTHPVWAVRVKFISSMSSLYFLNILIQPINLYSITFSYNLAYILDCAMGWVLKEHIHNDCAEPLLERGWALQEKIHFPKNNLSWSLWLVVGMSERRTL